MEHGQQGAESVGAILSGIAELLRDVSGRLDAVAAQVADDNGIETRLKKLEAWAFRTEQDVSALGARLEGADPAAETARHHLPRAESVSRLVEGARFEVPETAGEIAGDSGVPGSRAGRTRARAEGSRTVAVGDSGAGHADGRRGDPTGDTLSGHTQGRLGDSAGSSFPGRTRGRRADSAEGAPVGAEGHRAESTDGSVGPVDSLPAESTERSRAEQASGAGSATSNASRVEQVGTPNAPGREHSPGRWHDSGRETTPARPNDANAFQPFDIASGQGLDAVASGQADTGSARRLDSAQAQFENASGVRSEAADNRQLDSASARHTTAGHENISGRPLDTSLQHESSGRRDSATGRQLDTGAALASGPRHETNTGLRPSDSPARPETTPAEPHDAAPQQRAAPTQWREFTPAQNPQRDQRPDAAHRHEFAPAQQETTPVQRHGDATEFTHPDAPPPDAARVDSPGLTRSAPPLADGARTAAEHAGTSDAARPTRAERLRPSTPADAAPAATSRLTDDMIHSSAPAEPQSTDSFESGAVAARVESSPTPPAPALPRREPTAIPPALHDWMEPTISRPPLTTAPESNGHNQVPPNPDPPFANTYGYESVFEPVPPSGNGHHDTPISRPDANLTAPRPDRDDPAASQHRAPTEDNSHVDKLQAMLDELKRNPAGPFGRPLNSPSGEPA